jgi:hypothetical protein
MLVKHRAQIYDPGAGTLMDTDDSFWTPPTDLPLTMGGGVRNVLFSLAGPLLYVAEIHWSRLPPLTIF